MSNSRYKVEYVNNFLNSQTIGEKVYSQEGNSPDHLLKSQSNLAK